MVTNKDSTWKSSKDFGISALDYNISRNKALPQVPTSEALTTQQDVHSDGTMIIIIGVD